MSTQTRACARVLANARRGRNCRNEVMWSVGDQAEMEFRCRLGTPGGEIIEGVYVADSEARLRREFEEKGLYVLAIQRAGRLALGSLALPTRSRIATREFLVFNQELATLLKAGMPLVQSLDILRRRVTQPALQVGARRRLRARAAGQLAVGGVRGARRAVSRRLHGVAAGRREERQPRAGHPPLRRLRQGGRERPPQDHLGARSTRPSCSCSRSIVVVGILVLRVVPQFAGFYEQFGQELPLSTRIIVAISTYATTYFGAAGR